MFDMLICQYCVQDDPILKSVEGVTANLIEDIAAFEEASVFANTLAKWSETRKAKNQLHELMLKFVSDAAINAMNDRHKAAAEERLKKFKRSEFEIITKFGSRKTRWETLYDSKKKKHFTINVDTLQKLADKWGICEFCDATLDPADLRCFVCNNPRTVKNMKLYRPLGT